MKAAPRRVRLPEGTLVLPPVAMRDLPPGGAMGSFRGIASLTFVTQGGTVAVFLHDLGPSDLESILREQRTQAEAQLGTNYDRELLWWEKS